ncbi:MAG TPA: multiubiquitin domain-containing protein [Candidatus Acidoferrum sp.]|nr:multiubiquitin domain-containing protein [Candidatus Acidoferrum sp.]
MNNSQVQQHGDRFEIIVNGQKKQVTTETVTFDQVVKLAFPTPPTGGNILFTVSYEDGPHANPQGSLQEGGTVQVKNGMIFNVTATDKS